MNITYAVSLVISTCISLMIALVALNRRTAPGASGLVFYMLCCAVWAGTYAVRWTTSDIAAQIFWLDATYFGVVGLSTAFLIFALQFTERSHVITRRNLALFSIVPVLTLVMLWTDRWFGLFFGGIPRTTGSIFNGGPAFWLFVVYAYVLIFIAIGIFFQAFWRSSGLYRLQVAAIVFAGCLPVVGNILSLAGFIPFPNLDLTPFIFMASGSIFAYGLFGFRLMDVVPIARHKLVDEMTDGIIVLDASKRIVDVNPAAQRLIGISYSSIGKTSEDVLSTRLHLDLTSDLRAVSLTELRVSENPVLDIELQVLPLLDNYQKISGHLLILHDVTERKQAEEQLRESEEKFRSLLDSQEGNIMVLDFDGVHHYTNQASVGSITSSGTAQDIIGKRLHDLYPASIADWQLEQVQRVITTGQGMSGDYQNVVNNQTSWWHLNLQPIRNGSGQIVQVMVNSLNITERKQMEDALRESEARFRSYFELPLGGRAITSPTKGWLDVNSELCDMLGYTKAELIQMTWAELTHLEDIAIDMTQFNRVMAGEIDGYTIEKRFIHKDGRSIHTHIAVQCIRLPDRSVDYFVALLLDITELKQVVAELRENGELLREVGHVAKVGGWNLDLTTNELTWTEETYIIHEIDQHLKPQLEDGINFYAPDARPVLQAAVEHAIAQGTPYDLELPFITAKGNNLWVRTIGNTNVVDGRVVRLYGIFQDITESKRAEDALRDKEEQYRAIAESSSDYIMRYDRNFRHIFANQIAIKFTGLPVDQYIGKNHREMGYPVELCELWEEHIQKVFDTGRPSKVEFAVETAQEMLYLDLVFSPEFSSDGSVNSVIGISRDATDRKRAEDKIRQLNATLEQRVEERTVELVHANQVKDEFLASMSHELRTPLNAISGYSQLLLEGLHGPINDKQKQCLRIINSSCEHLLGLITDILDVSKIESGQFTLHLESVDVNEVCKASMVFVNQFAEQKNIEMDYSSSEDEPVILADAKRLKQILVNLLNNAVKFTPEKGRIKLEVRTDVGAGLMRFSVTDTGIGISAEDLPKLFKPFVQLDGSLSRQYQGTGLGLSLVKRLVEIQGGSVDVQSKAGAGSCFTFVLPWQDASMDNKGRDVIVADGQNGGRVKILIADDNEVNVMVIRDYLENFGYEVSVAFDGAEALLKVEQEIPDLILMDIQMPYVNGIELTRRLRTDPRFATVPIIAFTALALSGDRERCFEAGMNEYMSKPVSLKEVRTMVERFLVRA